MHLMQKYSKKKRKKTLKRRLPSNFSPDLDEYISAMSSQDTQELVEDPEEHIHPCAGHEEVTAT